MAVAIYPGSFDPITNGHLDIIERGSKVFDTLIVTVLENPRKNPMFTLKERLDMLRTTTEGMKNVGVDCYRGLLIDYAREKKSHIIVKGLRAISDFELEFQMALVNRKLDCEIETMFMMTNNKYSYLSSSIVKEIASFGGDITSFLPPAVCEKVLEKSKSINKQ